MHVEIDKIIFKKSFRQQDSHIFIFLGRDNPSFKHVVEKEKEELLRQVNQDRLLYALAIEFTDFICCEKFMESELVPS